MRETERLNRSTAAAELKTQKQCPQLDNGGKQGVEVVCGESGGGGCK